MNKSLTQWRDYISTSLKKTALATLETAERIAKYRESSEKEEFEKNMREWFNFSPSHLSYWKKIEEKKERFSNNIESIPSSPRALYELASIDDDLWDEIIEEGNISPSLTVEGIKSIKTNGGLMAKASKKYSEANNYLEIMQTLSAIRQNTSTIKECEKQFEAWLKDNPPDWGDEDDENMPEEPKNRVSREAIALYETSKEVRIKCLASFGIFIDKPIKYAPLIGMLEELAGDDEHLLACLKVLKGK